MLTERWDIFAAFMAQKKGWPLPTSIKPAQAKMLAALVNAEVAEQKEVENADEPAPQPQPIEPPKPTPQKRFVPPTLEEVREYIAKNGYNVDAEQFLDFYTAKGWRIGNHIMKDWKAAVRTWHKRAAQMRPQPTQTSTVYKEKIDLNF